MFLIDHRFLMIYYKVELQKLITLSTDTNTVWLTISRMVFIQTGLLLSNLFDNRKIRKHPYLLHVKKVFVKMSSVLLGSCKLDLL